MGMRGGRFRAYIWVGLTVAAATGCVFAQCGCQSCTRDKYFRGRMCCGAGTVGTGGWMERVCWDVVVKESLFGQSDPETMRHLLYAAVVFANATCF